MNVLGDVVANPLELDECLPEYGAGGGDARG